MSKILLGVTGSIAAYKAVEIARQCQARDWSVRVVMTTAATEFVTPLTFQTISRNEVSTDMFEKVTSWSPAHVSLAQWPDVFLVAPCTANVIARLALGLADDLLSATALAARVPIVIAPAMNEGMWDHPATQSNIAMLKERGVTVVTVAEGELACGDEGRGRMAAIETILAAVEKTLAGR